MTAALQRTIDQDNWDHNWYARLLTPRPLSLEEEAKEKERADVEEKELMDFIRGMLIALLVFALFSSVLLATAMLWRSDSGRLTQQINKQF